MNGDICAYGTQTVAINANQPPMTHKFTDDGSMLVPVEPKEKGEPRLPSTEAKGKL